MGRPQRIETELGRRLVLVRGDRSREDFARHLGVPVSTLGNYERGDREPDWTFLLRLREKEKVDLNWLSAFDVIIADEMHRVRPDGLVDQPQRGQPDELGDDEEVALPRYDIRASAGPGSVALIEDVADFMTVSKTWLSRYVSPNSTIGVIEARGDSMEPTIADGDLLMVTHDINGDDVSGGGIFVLSVDGSLMVKRLQRATTGDIRVISDNDRHYAPEVIPADELSTRLIIHARVFWHGGPPRRR